MLCIVSKYHLQDIKKQTKKRTKTSLRRFTAPLRRRRFTWPSRLGPAAVFRSLGPPRDESFSGHQRRNEVATSGSRSSDLSGTTTAFPPYRSMLTRSRCLCFWFWFFLFCWNLHRHCKGRHRTPSLPRWLPLFLVFYTVRTFSGTYTTSVTVDVSLFFTVAIIYIFGALVHGKHV